MPTHQNSKKANVQVDSSTSTNLHLDPGQEVRKKNADNAETPVRMNSEGSLSGPTLKQSKAELVEDISELERRLERLPSGDPSVRKLLALVSPLRLSVQMGDDRSSIRESLGNLCRLLDAKISNSSSPNMSTELEPVRTKIEDLQKQIARVTEQVPVEEQDMLLLINLPETRNNSNQPLPDSSSLAKPLEIVLPQAPKFGGFSDARSTAKESSSLMETRASAEREQLKLKTHSYYWSDDNKLARGQAMQAIAGDRKLREKIGSLVTDVRRAYDKDKFDVVVGIGRSGFLIGTALVDADISFLELPPLRRKGASCLPLAPRPETPIAETTLKDILKGRRVLFLDDQIGIGTTLAYARAKTLELGVASFVGAGFHLVYNPEYGIFGSLLPNEIDIRNGLHGTYWITLNLHAWEQNPFILADSQTIKNVNEPGGRLQMIELARAVWRGKLAAVSSFPTLSAGAETRALDAAIKLFEVSPSPRRKGYYHAEERIEVTQAQLIHEYLFHHTVYSKTHGWICTIAPETGILNPTVKPKALSFPMPSTLTDNTRQNAVARYLAGVMGNPTVMDALYKAALGKLEIAERVMIEAAGRYPGVKNQCIAEYLLTRVVQTEKGWECLPFDSNTANYHPPE